MKNKIQWITMTLLLVTSSIVLAQTDKTIYLVRHAEKMADDGNDPQLTQQGEQRAKNLAKILQDKKIKYVFTSDYQRTRQTAEPSAKAFNLVAQKYDPRQLKAFAETVQGLDGNVLIVGHSNTTPMLAFLLGGDALGDIDDSDYSRLYQLTIKNDQVSTRLLDLPPLLKKPEIRAVALKPGAFGDRTLKFQMLYQDKVVGESLQKVTEKAGQIQLFEKTVLAGMNIDATINVTADAKTLAPIAMQMSGSMGSPVDIDLHWQAGRVKGYSLIERAPYQQQGKLDIDEAALAQKVERSSLILAADRIAVTKDKPYVVQWFDAYSGETRDIEVSYQGEAQVTVPAGTFETYKLQLLGGAPSQLFYISKGRDSKVVKIEVIAMPWVYELLE